MTFPTPIVSPVELKKRLARYVLLATILLATACDLFGQAASGTVGGKITDNTGAVVPDVAVTLTNESTGFARTVSSNQSGQYVAEFFPIGRIRIVARKSGFN